MSVRVKGPVPVGWEPSSPKGRAVLADVIDRYRQHYREGTLPRGGRGIFYDLRPRGFGRGVRYVKRGKDRTRWHDPSAPTARAGRWAPDEVGPDYVQDIVASARRAGLIGESWVADIRTPPSWLPIIGAQTAEEEAELVLGIVQEASVTLDRQTDQPVYVELWCEAGDLVERLARVAEEYDVPVYSGGGMDGLKGKRAAAERIAERARKGQATAVLLVGDLDRHGRIIRDVYEQDVTAWLVDGYGVGAEFVEFATIAVTEEQAREHDLLDDEGKAEADGIPVPVLDGIVRDGIESRQDPARRDALPEREREINETLRRLIAEGVEELAAEGGGDDE